MVRALAGRARDAGRRRGGPVAALRRALRDAASDAAAAAEARCPRGGEGDPRPAGVARSRGSRSAAPICARPAFPRAPPIGRALARTLAALEEGRVDRSGTSSRSRSGRRGEAEP